MRKPTVLAIMVFLVASVALFIRSIYYDHALSSDQTFFQLVYQGKTDPMYEDYRVPALDVYVPFQLTNLIRRFVADPVWVYRAILPFLIFFYLLAFFFLLRRVVRSPFICIVIPLLSLIPRTALGSQYWGIIGSGHATHRALIQPLLVVAFLLYYSLRHRRTHLLIFFCALGLASALYPTQGVYFALILLLVHLILRGWRWRTLIECTVFGLAFILGSLPHLIPAATVGLNIDKLSPSMIPEFNEALRYRFAYTFYPWSLWTYTKSIILDVFVLAIVALFASRLQSRYSPQQQGWLRYSRVFLYATLLVTFLVPLLQDAVSILFHTRLFIFDQFGESKFVYLALYVILAIVIDALLGWQRWTLARRRIAVFCIITALAVANLFMLQGVIRRVYPLQITTAENRSNLSSLCAWVRENAQPVESLLAEDFELRYCSGRKLWANWKDGMVYLYAKTAEEFVAWYRRVRRQEKIYRDRNWQELARLADQENIRFIILKTHEWGNLPADEVPVYSNPDYAVFDRGRFER